MHEVLFFIASEEVLFCEKIVVFRVLPCVSVQSATCFLSPYYLYFFICVICICTTTCAIDVKT